MPKEPINREIAFSGLHVRRKVIFALSLCSLLPLLLLTYAFNAPLREFLGPLAGLADLVSVPAILLFTGLLMAGGAFVVWDIATALSRAAQISSDQHPEVQLGETDGADRKLRINWLIQAFDEDTGI